MEDLCIPDGWTEADAAKLRAEGADGRKRLEKLVGCFVCGNSACLRKDRHTGNCYFSPLVDLARVRKPKKVFEGAEEEACAVKRRKPSAPPAASVSKRKLQPKPSPPPKVPQALQWPRLPNELLTCSPSAWSRSDGVGVPGVASLEAVRSAMHHIPNMRAAPTFLETNAQAHPTPFSPLADLVDNAVEAGATRMSIELTQAADFSVLHMHDDGCGMSERQLLDGPLSLAYTSKAGTHYGMGATTSIPAISPYALILSSVGGTHRTIGCLSSELSVHVGAEQTKMPQCSWALAAGGSGWEVMATSEAEAPLSLEARQASLALLTSFGPYRSEAALMAAFEALPTSGTAVVLWGDALDAKFRRDAADITVTAHAPSDSRKWGHDTSLREFLSVLYYVDDDHPPPLAIHLMGRVVEPRNWSAYLHQAHATSYSPQGASDSVRIQFGHQVPLAELVAHIREKRAHKDTALQDYRGIFYYNRDADKTRLILPLEPTRVQHPLANGIFLMAITERRICDWGYGVIGVAIESHLRPAHNKREYVAQDTSIVFQTLKKALDDKMRAYLKTVVTPAYQRLRSGDTVADLGLFDAAAARKQQKKQQKKRDSDRRQQPLISAEDVRVRAPDGTVGRTVFDLRKGHFKLQLPTGEIDFRKAYRADELVATAFDPARDVPPGFAPLPCASLSGRSIEVCWIDAETDDRLWERGALAAVDASAMQDGSAEGAAVGWVLVHYEAAELGTERLFIAARVRPSDGASLSDQLGGGDPLGLGRSSGATLDATQPRLAEPSDLVFYRTDGEELKHLADVRFSGWEWQAAARLVAQAGSRLHATAAEGVGGAAAGAPGRVLAPGHGLAPGRVLESQAPSLARGGARVEASGAHAVPACVPACTEVAAAIAPCYAAADASARLPLHAAQRDARTANGGGSGRPRGTSASSSVGGASFLLAHKAETEAPSARLEASTGATDAAGAHEMASEGERGSAVCEVIALSDSDEEYEGVPSTHHHPVVVEASEVVDTASGADGTMVSALQAELAAAHNELAITKKRLVCASSALEDALARELAAQEREAALQREVHQLKMRVV